MKNFSHLMLFKAESPDEADNVIVCSNILGKRRKYFLDISCRVFEHNTGLG